MRPAPSAVRMASSRPRTAPRARLAFARFAQATSSTTPTAAAEQAQIRLGRPDDALLQRRHGDAAAVQIFRVRSVDARGDRSHLRRGPRAIVTPGASRAIAWKLMLLRLAVRHGLPNAYGTNSSTPAGYSRAGGSTPTTR